MDIQQHFNCVADAGTHLGFTRGLLAAASLFSMFSDEYQRIMDLAYADTRELALRQFDENTRDMARGLVAQKTPEVA